MGIGGGFSTCPSFSLNPSCRLFLFHVVKPADTGPFCCSNRASSDVAQTTEVAWGEQLETHTCTHTWQKAQKVDFFFESSWVIRTLAAESCRLWRVSQTDIEMLWGASSAGGMKRRSILLWSSHIPPSLWKCEEERGREWGPFKPGVDGRGAEKNRTRSVYDSTLCEGRLPCVSLRLSQVERSCSETQAFFIYISGLISFPNLLLAGDLLEIYLLSLEDSTSFMLLNEMCFFFLFYVT